MILAHLIGEAWHVQDLLLYGGAGLALVLGGGLLFWGRHERIDTSTPPPPEDEKRRPHPLIRST
jgi:hypothetical protein